MGKVEHYVFRPMRSSDRRLLRAWRAQPHVSQWWGPWSASEEEWEDPRVKRWMIETADQPFAYLQDYAVHDWPGHHFGYLPVGARGIDQFIGDASMLGRGHGCAFIAQCMRKLFASGAPVLATDPHPANERAIAVYRKLGFRIAGPSSQTAWGWVLPMEAWAHTQDMDSA